MSTFTLDAAALANNLALAREWAPQGALVRAMVKADAYGHGLHVLAGVFSEHADQLGVATMEEGIALRAWLGDDHDAPIYLASGAKEWDDPAALSALRDARLVPAVSSVDELRQLADRAGGDAALDVELKLDSGMGRLGIRESTLAEVVSILQRARSLRVVGLMTHYASSDERDLTATREQDAAFRRMLAKIPADLVASVPRHSCNSGALIQRALGHTDLAVGSAVVRPGVMLYGAAPSQWLHETPAGSRLRPVGRWTSRVIEVKTMEPGDAVGYGGTWRVEGDDPVRVAVLRVGYADGFRRMMGNRTRVLIRGGSFPVIGRVSMDLVSVLVNDRIEPGDEAVLLGAQEGELGAGTIDAWEWAELCATIPYEIWTSIGARVERVLATA